MAANEFLKQEGHSINNGLKDIKTNNTQNARSEYSLPKSVDEESGAPSYGKYMDGTVYKEAISAK